MKFSLWTNYGALNSKPVFDSFRTGATRLGFECADNSPNSDVDVIWSVLWSGRMQRNRDIWARAKKKNKPVIVIEVGGIKRGTTWRVGLNGVNRDAYFAPDNNTDQRAKQLGLELQPWRAAGDYVLICGQHEQSQQWQGLPPMSQWLERKIQEIRQYTDRKIVFRPHPRSPVRLKNNFKDFVYQSPIKKKGSYDDYEINFNGAWAVINECSNPGIHAAIAGVPVFVNQSSLAYPVGNTDISQIESPLMPDRTQWLNDLAHKEYTVEEIQQGIPLKYLTEQLR
jgi:hypothetical protein